MKNFAFLLFLFLITPHAEAAHVDDHVSGKGIRPSSSRERYVGMGSEDVDAITFGPAFGEYFTWCREHQKSCNIPAMKEKLKRDFDPDEIEVVWAIEFENRCRHTYHNPPDKLISEMFYEMLEEIKKEREEEEKPRRHSYSSTSSDEDGRLEGAQGSQKGDKQS